MKRLLAIAVLAASLCGCATYTVSDAGGRTTVDIQNTGWFLFNILPIASGDPAAPNRSGCSFFTDTVTLDSNMQLLRHAMIREGAYKAENVVSRTTDEKIFAILLKRAAYHTSAELIK